MIDISQIEYSMFDSPEILSVLFHPRPEFSAYFEKRVSTKDVIIPVDKDVGIGARLHLAGQSYPNILFFHGNGEIVSDYDDIGLIYNEAGINFLAVDYRGYGQSTGTPTVTHMMRDTHLIFQWAQQELKKNGNIGQLIVMGRSLGSAPALELISNYANEIDGLIIESGFSIFTPLLELLGIDLEEKGIREEEGPKNIDKIKGYTKPTLIIHAEYDHIIPFAEGQALFDSSPAKDKSILKIPHADHNTIFQYGMSEYMAAIKGFIQRCSG